VDPGIRAIMRSELMSSERDLTAYVGYLGRLRDLSSDNGRVIDEIRNTLQTIIHGLQATSRIAQRVGL
jgi:hypothetical protein